MAKQWLRRRNVDCLNYAIFYLFLPLHFLFCFVLCFKYHFFLLKNENILYPLATMFCRLNVIFCNVFIMSAIVESMYRILLGFGSVILL